MREAGADAEVPVDTTLLGPLKRPGFRMLWLAWLAGNMTMWMHEMTAGWRMSQLTDSPALVAWVQAAGTLPLFVLGLASGALADQLERHRFLAFSQAWIALVALGLAVGAATDTLTPATLLVLCVLNGIGLALRFPVFSALVPDMVPREQLSAALTLNALAINLTRVIGPLLAGAVLAWSSTAAVFALNAATSVLAGMLILRAPRTAHLPHGLHGPRTAHERVGSLAAAMGEGLRHVRASRVLRAILIRAFVFFVQAAGLVALLPLLAHRIGADAGSYTLMLAAMGAGAVLAALALPRLPATGRRNLIVDAGVVLQALATTAAVLTPGIGLMLAALALSGAVWLCVANTLTMAAQLALTGAVRARGISIYQMSIMGGSAAGAALWGLLAEWTTVGTSLLLSAAAALLMLGLTRRVSLESDCGFA